MANAKKTVNNTSAHMTFKGVITNDIVLNTTKTGKKVVNIIAKTEDEHPLTCKATFWEDMAEKVVTQFRTGDKVFMEGDPSSDSWIDKNDSSKAHSMLVIRNGEISLIQ